MSGIRTIEVWFGAIGGGGGSRSWPNTISRANASNIFDGRRDNCDSRINPAPIVAITSNISSRNCGSKESAKLTTVNSTAINISPLPSSQRRAVFGSGLALREMAAETPDRNTKDGAQKCVIQRVKKNNGVVAARSVGLWVWDQVWRKSRLWSRAMMTMTKPRAISMEGMRFIRGMLLLKTTRGR